MYKILLIKILRIINKKPLKKVQFKRGNYILTQILWKTLAEKILNDWLLLKRFQFLFLFEL